MAGAPLGIVAGAGGLPGAVAHAALASGREPVIVALAGIADLALLPVPPAATLGLGQVGAAIRTFRSRGAAELVLAGAVVRPDLASLKFDFGLLRRLPDVVRLSRAGDDGVLRIVVRFFEDEGFRVVGAHEVAPSLLAGSGALGRREPDAEALADVALGLDVVAALGRFDVGQAVVVENARVLAVEAAEGTDETIARVAELRRVGRLPARRGRAVLVKVPKPGQDNRVDMPAIGLRTVTACVAAGVTGIAVRAGGVIVLDRSATVAAADSHGVFLHGIAS